MTNEELGRLLDEKLSKHSRPITRAAERSVRWDRIIGISLSALVIVGSLLVRFVFVTKEEHSVAARLAREEAAAVYETKEHANEATARIEESLGAIQSDVKELLGGERRRTRGRYKPK